jgi:acyl-Coa thioesterase superfamily protein/acyl-CoA thioesterase superfamily protein
VSESVFGIDARLGPGHERFVPTEHARGPWDPNALHGGAPAALMTSAFEHVEPGSELQIARLGFELLRPIPFAPLSISTRIVRAGRRVQELAGELRAFSEDGASEELIFRASALRVQELPSGLPAPPPEDPPMRGPDAGTEIRFALDGSDRASFAASAMQMRWLSDPHQLGAGQVWMRLRHPLVPGQAPSALARLAATADFGNGVSAVLPFERFLFINADLTIHLQREPLGEWIGLDARTLLHRGGSGLAESVIHDSSGAVGRAFQTLVVAAR